MTVIKDFFFILFTHSFMLITLQDQRQKSW